MTKALPPGLVERLTAITGKKQAAIEYGPIGIDLDDTGVRMVQFRKKDGHVELFSSAYQSLSVEVLDSGKKTRSVIRQALRKHGFIGREVVTCMQPKDVRIMMISYLHQSGKPDEEQIVQRVAERIEDDISNYVIDFQMVRPQVKDRQERSALVAMARRDRVVDYLELLRTAGLLVRVLEIEPTAIRRLVLNKHGNDHQANLMVVSMGRSQTYITVLSGRRMIYERGINFGEQQLVELMCRELDLDEHEARSMLIREESLTVDINQDDQNITVMDALYGVLKPLFMELVEDINRALVYAASETRGMPVEHIYLTNVVASWRGIEHFIDSLIEVPVSVLAPFEGFVQSDAMTPDSDPRAAVVTGMALLGLTEAA